MIKNAAITPKDDGIIPDFCNSTSLFILITLSQLIVVIDLLFSMGTHIDWSYFGLSTLYVQWQALISAGLMCRLRPILRHFNDATAILLTYFSLLTLAITLSLIVQWALPTLSQFNWNFVIKNTLLSAIIIGIGLHYLYLQHRILTQQKSELYSDLLALQARIRPHFLFNCLNSITSLIAVSPEKAEQMIVDLSELLRSSLRHDVIETSIENEWGLCIHYLEIENHRLAERLSWSYNFDKLDTTLSIPNLSLQPIIENAIYHGIQPNPESGSIAIKGTSQQNIVTISVTNTQAESNKKSPTPSSGHQMALSNIQDRLHHLYGKNAKINKQSKDNFYTVTLTYDLSERRL